MSPKPLNRCTICRRLGPLLSLGVIVTSTGGSAVCRHCLQSRRRLSSLPLKSSSSAFSFCHCCLRNPNHWSSLFIAALEIIVVCLGLSRRHWCQVKTAAAVETIDVCLRPLLPIAVQPRRCSPTFVAGSETIAICLRPLLRGHGTSTLLIVCRC
ncbi:hypothetical protein Syun_009506 [Stephania yunnanensis]|uniref:Uncharacterized protein n=1 Tax=Stephania yunnanensis TaxID=152371 RepID=A0AAP0KES1_9MAGN